MKRKQEKPAYDRIAAGERLRCRRLELGWSSVKLYFMMGLPTETYEDLDGIAEISKNIRGRAARCRQQILCGYRAGNLRHECGNTD